MTVVLLAIAGGLGALTRAEWTRFASTRWPGTPWGTRTVNLLGTAALAALLAAGLAGDPARIAGVGYLGGLTTFSTWMLDADETGGPTGRFTEVAFTLGPALVIAATLRALA